MQTKTTIVISLPVLLSAAVFFNVPAQSVFSFQSLTGLPTQHATGPSQAIGGSGVGVASDYFGMADNPGNLGAMTRSSFSLLTSLDLLSINDDEENTRHVKLSPMLLSFAFPLKQAGTFGFSLDRRSDARLNFRAQERINADQDTLDFGIDKNGGLTSWQAGWGYAIGPWVKLGICYERMYLLADEVTMWHSTISNVTNNPEYFLYDTATVSLRGNAVRAGVLVPLKKITIGLAGEYILPGTAKRRSIIQSVDRTDTVITHFSLNLPPSLGAGLSYTFSPRWFVAAAGGVTLWQRYESDVRLGNSLDDAYTFSVGGQFIPAPNLLVPRYWEIMQYRAGFRYSQLPTGVGSEIAFTASLGLPFQQSSGLFDIIVDAGRRTDATYDGYEENFLQVKVGLNGGRKWFQNTGMRY
jgi:hypothetical protein